MLRKLSKTAILKSNVLKMCNTVKKPPTALALPAQGTLLRGVVRIHGKQMTYLQLECVDLKTKLLYGKPAGDVDLPIHKQTSRFENVTFSEGSKQSLTIDPAELGGDIDSLLNLADAGGAVDLDFSLAAEWDATYQARQEDITLASDESSLASGEGAFFPEEPLDFLPSADVLFEEPPAPATPAPSEVPSDEAVAAGLDQEAQTAAAPPSEEENLSAPRPKRQKRPKELKVDPETELSNECIREGLANTDDITCQRPLKAPKQGAAQQVKDALQLAGPADGQLDGVAEDLLQFWKWLWMPKYVAPVLRSEGVGAVPEQMAFGDLSDLDSIPAARGKRGLSTGFGSDLEAGRAATDLESVASGASFLELARGLDLGDPNSRRHSRASLLSVDDSGFDTSMDFGVESPIGTGEMDVRHLTDTPDLDVSLTQFDLPVISESQPRLKSAEPRPSTELTKVVRRIIGENFQDIEPRLSAGKKPYTSFEAILKRGMQEYEQQGHPARRLSRIDAAHSFYQILTLKTASIINVYQARPYGPIICTQGPRWRAPF